MAMVGAQAGYLVVVVDGAPCLGLILGLKRGTSRRCRGFGWLVEEERLVLEVFLLFDRFTYM